MYTSDITKLYKTTILILLSSVICMQLSASEYVLNKNNTLIFSYTNTIGLEIYEWQSTLLTYPIEFEDDIREHELNLIDKKTGEKQGFQLSDIESENGFLQKANLNFMASLPYKGDFCYELSYQKEDTSHNKMIIEDIQFNEQANYYEIKGNKLQIRLSKSQNVASKIAPAPILSLALNDGTNDWIGRNQIISQSKTIQSIKSETIEKGQLFIKQEISYVFESGGVYKTTITFVKDYPFVILDEEMVNLSVEDSIIMQLAWSDFNPNKRFATQWDRTLESADRYLSIDKPIYTGYTKEDPKWTGFGWIENPAEQMTYRLSPYGGNSVREQVPVISFWEEYGQNRELGVFVYDFNYWNDYQYGIWQPTPLLSVLFQYRNNQLNCIYPIVTGTRSTAISFFKEEEGLKQIDLFNQKLKTISDNGGRHNPKDLSYRYSQRLLMDYSTLSLNKIKDWQLSYSYEKSRGENYFPNRTNNSKEDFIKAISTSAMAYYPMGLNYYPGIHSIEHRQLYSSLVEDYLKFYRELSVSDREMSEALLLLGAYVNILEEMNAIRTSLAGTPNMAADGWCVPAQIAYLFPEHTMAKEWLDYFEKSLEIYGLFYTRPDVLTYDSKGGRWTESLGIYNWAFLRPTSHSNIAGQLFDKKNRFASEYMTKRAEWMLNMVTAPIENKGRFFPPHGAHSTGYLVERYLPMHQTAQWLYQYNPILAEYLFWTGQPGKEVEKKKGDTDWYTPFQKSNAAFTKGTNPHLRSVKYTGHGVVLRSGVNTSEELSIHLEQIDKGPNYRWGNQAEGNSGGLYFYAKGKIYTAHENEIAGDHVVNNLDGVTNFGIMKNGEYRTIGMNELKAPLFDFNFAQFAELKSDDSADKYVWPEYLSRSIMLAGTDYFILFDEVGVNWRAAGRFSWFNHKDETFPKITFLSKPARKDAWMKVQTPNSKGFYRDSFGSLLTLVTHKSDEVFVKEGKELEVVFLENSNITDFRFDSKAYPNGVIPIQTKNSEDFVFRDECDISYSSANTKFKGKAGLIRRFHTGRVEMSIFKGKEIEADGLNIQLNTKGESAIALVSDTSTELYGKIKTDTIVDIIISGELLSKGNLYIDGQKVTSLNSQNQIKFTLEKGEYNLEYTNSQATPMESFIVSSEYEKNRVKLLLHKGSGCKSVKIQISENDGLSWNTIGTTSKEYFYITKLQQPLSFHVRAISLNGNKEAKYGQEYPIHLTAIPPKHPDGLWLKLDNNTVELSWGEVLGVQKYRLYRRVKGEETFQIVYEGKQRAYKDLQANGVIPAFDIPGKTTNSLGDVFTVYEYAITTINGYGESELSPIEDTHPASWRNWYPKTELKFKRQSAFWLPPYIYPSMVPAKYYPN